MCSLSKVWWCYASIMASSRYQGYPGYVCVAASERREPHSSRGSGPSTIGRHATTNSPRGSLLSGDLGRIHSSHVSSFDSRTKDTWMGSSVYIAGAAKNLHAKFEQYLPKHSRNLAMLMSYWRSATTIIYADERTSLFYRAFNDSRIVFIKEEYEHKSRTFRLAYARNSLIQKVGELVQLRGEAPRNVFLIMIDFDDITTPAFSERVFESALDQRVQWDALTFNRRDYYDLWALRFGEYSRNFQHPGFTNIADPDVARDSLHKQLQSTSFLPVNSSFAGIGIYKYNYTVGCKYLGYDEAGFNSPTGEDCEHVSFHSCIAKKNGARIRIFNESLV